MPAIRRRTALPVLALGAALAAALAVAPGCPGRETVAPSAAPAVLVPPLHDAEAGEILRMRRGNEEWSWRVTSVTDDEVEAEFVRRRDGEPAAAPEPVRWTRNGFGVPPGFIVREVRRDRIEVAGRAWDCWRLRAHAKGELRYYWITEELPAHGVLRLALDRSGSPDLGSAADAAPEGCEFPGGR